jgi:hypothetical protein
MNKNVVGLYRLMGSWGHEQKYGGLIPVNGILGIGTKMWWAYTG